MFVVVTLALAGVAAAAPATPAGPTVGLALQPSVGLEDAEVAQAKDELEKELAALGVTVEPAPPVEPACVPDPACVEKARGALPALLVVEMVRVGPVVQLTATGSSGEKHASGTHGLETGQLEKGPLLPDDVRAWLKALPAPKVEAAPAPPAPASSSTPFTPVQSGSLFAGGVGVIALAAGVVLVATAEPVLEDKTSSGAEKQQSSTLGLIGVASSAIGVVAIAAAAVGFFVLGAPAAEPAAPAATAPPTP